MSGHGKAMVLRLCNIPDHMDRLAVMKLLSESLEGVRENMITVYSLAHDVHTPSEKVATLIIESLPERISSLLQFSSMRISVASLPAPLFLDSHFEGLTPLNEIPEYAHTHDCFVISGLGSHPFGSWQPHGRDKSFMWIRDELPFYLPGIRFILYGYDTRLLGSGSFQTIIHLGNTLNNVLRSICCSEPSKSLKPIIFMAHSLGGALLKRSLIALAEGHEEDHRGQAILKRTEGALFFGVPTHGMSIPDLVTMIGSQPNTDLLYQLSDQSTFLQRLEHQFQGLSLLQGLGHSNCWAYETQTTQRLRSNSETGSFTRTGTPFVMVSPDSATRGLYKTRPHLTIQINKNHSDMVKFLANDVLIRVVAQKLGNMCTTAATRGRVPLVPTSLDLSLFEDSTTAGSLSPTTATATLSLTTGIGSLSPIPDYRHPNQIVSPQLAPEQDHRLEQPAWGHGSRHDVNQAGPEFTDFSRSAFPEPGHQAFAMRERTLATPSPPRKSLYPGTPHNRDLFRSPFPVFTYTERTASGRTILTEMEYGEVSLSEGIGTREAALLVARHLVTARHTGTARRHERILRTLINPRGNCAGSIKGWADFLLDDTALESVFSAADAIFFQGRLSQRVKWEWSSGTVDNADTCSLYQDSIRSLGKTGLRNAEGGGYETLTVLSPILRDTSYNRRLLISIFFQQLIHSYLLICCGTKVRDWGGRTVAFQAIASMIELWEGQGSLRLSEMETDLEYFRVEQPFRN